MSAAFSLSLVAEANVSSGLEVTAKTHPVPQVKKEHVMSCQQLHVKKLDESQLTYIDNKQSHIKGAAKCCQCAYNSGYQQGALLQEFISLDVNTLGDIPTSSDGRYRSVHQAFALGYQAGVNSFINNQ